jgi:predicted alpha/beta superfamily hydrolase
MRTAEDALRSAQAIVATDEARWQFPPIETHLLRSKHVAQTFKIEVAQPPSSRGDTARLPVVYVTDGNMVFRLFKEMSHLLQLYGLHPFPSFILVGISYPADSQGAGLLLRSRGFTLPDQPVPDAADLEASRSVYALLDGLLTFEEGSKTRNGAAEFRDFLGEELIPFINATYGSIADDRTYFGHSGGGLLGLYTLCTRPDLFRNYVISSPGWFRHKEDDFGFRMMQAFAAGKTLTEPTRLYLSVGSDEDFQPLYYGASKVGASLTADFYRLVAMLKNGSIPNLELFAEAIPGETHISVWPIAFMHGIQTVFGQRRIGGLY